MTLPALPALGLDVAPTALGLALALALSETAAAETVLYATGFEVSEGFVSGQPLVGQGGWRGDGSGGNGVTNGFFSLPGQQAFVGLSGPSGEDEHLLAWPQAQVTLNPCTAVTLRFAVEFRIQDSTNGEYDDFLWVLRNSQGIPLVALDFDNYGEIVWFGYNGEDDYIFTGVNALANRDYQLTVDLDFTGNRWSARLDDEVLVDGAPMSTAGAVRDFGHLEVGFLPYFPHAPGNNSLVFDNYRLVALPGAPPPPRVNLLGVAAAGARLRVHGRPGCAYTLEYSSALAGWTTLHTNTPSAAGYFDYTNSPPNPTGQRFYRAVWVP